MSLEQLASDQYGMRYTGVETIEAVLDFEEVLMKGTAFCPSERASVWELLDVGPHAHPFMLMLMSF